MKDEAKYRSEFQEFVRQVFRLTAWYTVQIMWHVGNCDVTNSCYVSL